MQSIRKSKKILKNKQRSSHESDILSENDPINDETRYRCIVLPMNKPTITKKIMQTRSIKWNFRASVK